jgi:hypothetical protein
MVKLFNLTHETTHLFYMGENLGCRYDGILQQDLWRNKGDTINYCNREITMDLDDEPDETTDTIH